MTKRSTSSTTDCASPFLLRPVGKNYLWGGNRLNDDFEKKLDIKPLAETWECATHPDGTSVVASGMFLGRELKEVLQEHPEFMGDRASKNGELPILIKLIDAKQDLSVQVHPDDEYAMIHENGSLGKTEMWYVLDAEKDTTLVYGFTSDMDKEKLRKQLEKGKIEKYLQKVPIKKNDVFFIEAGQVHAIGAGALIAEIQENSNITYRMYDYDRTDEWGNKRELHIEKALEVANLKRSKSPKQPLRLLKYQRGCATEFLCRCKYFQVERQIINTECNRDMVTCRMLENTFQVLLCVEGCGTLFDTNGEVIHFIKGDCIFVPANSAQMKLHGMATLLRVSC